MWHPEKGKVMALYFSYQPTSLSLRISVWLLGMEMLKERKENKLDIKNLRELDCSYDPVAKLLFLENISRIHCSWLSGDDDDDDDVNCKTSSSITFVHNGFFSPS